jgi:hypothetical protein
LPCVPIVCRMMVGAARQRGARGEVMSTIDGGVVLACRIDLVRLGEVYARACGVRTPVGLTSPCEEISTCVSERPGDGRVVVTWPALPGNSAVA